MENPNEHEGCGEPTVDVEKPKKSVELDPKNIRVRPPVYERELSMYEKTTLEEINNFRAARSRWLLKREEKQKIFTDDTEAKDSHLYKGRCSWIRKLGRKNSLLRKHYHGLRPARYWTIKRKVAPTHEEDELLRVLNDLKAERAKKEKFQDPCQEVSLWTREDVEACQSQGTRFKEKKAQKLLKRICEEKRAKGPCKQALKRLKDAKLSEGLLESCKCDAGREVTLVIKGFCLCDQTGLNKVNLSKVCDGYQKKDDDFVPLESKSRESELTLRQMGKLRLNEEDLGNKEPPPKDQRTVKVETKSAAVTSGRKPGLSDSLLLTKKKIEAIQKHEETVTAEPKEEVCKTENESITSFTHNRKVTFKNADQLKGDGGGTRGTPSDLTLFRKFSSESVTSDQLFPKIRMKEVPAHALHEHEVPITSDSLRTLLESKKYAKQMPETDSMNNLLPYEGGGDIKVNFKKKQKEMKVEDNKLGTKNGSPRRKLSNLAVNGLSRLSSSLEIHKKNMKANQSALKTESSSLLKDLTKDKYSKKKNEKPAPKVRLNTIPKVISIDEAPFLKEEKEMPATGNIQKTPEKIMPPDSEKTQDGFHKTWYGGRKPVEPFSTAPYEERDNELEERSAKMEDVKSRISETPWDAEKPPPENKKNEKLKPKLGPSDPDITRLMLKKVLEEEHMVPASEIDMEGPKKKETKEAGPQGCDKCNKEEEDKKSGGIKDSSERQLTEGPEFRDDASMITLFKNKSGVKSELGLTKEELLKMKIMGMKDTESTDPLKMKPNSVTEVKSKNTRELPNLK